MRGLYIHVPFCKSKCPYCHFYSETFFNVETVKKYFNACIEDIRGAADKFFDTVYIGGGTPSVIPAKALNGFVASLLKEISFGGREFTVEANPDSISEDFISFLKDSAVNRVSLGVQSFDDKTLKLLGRIHSAEDAYNAALKLKKTGKILNMDMIYDIPGIKAERFKETAATIADLFPEHVSAYSYSPEDRNYLEGFDEDETLFFYMENFFEKAGLMKYETSNFARAGKKSLHNSIYWAGEEYIGIGCASHSMLYAENGERIRYSRPADIKQYIENPASFDILERLDKATAAKETLITGLRTAEGVNIDLLEKRFGKLCKNLIDCINLLVENGMLKWKVKNILTSKKGASLLESLSSRLWRA